MPGFKSYSLIEDGNGGMSSIGVFDTPAQADESTRVAATSVRGEARDGTCESAPRSLAER